MNVLLKTRLIVISQEIFSVSLAFKSITRVVNNVRDIMKSTVLKISNTVARWMFRVWVFGSKEEGKRGSQRRKYTQSFHS